jgi:hypothetical protein
MSLEFMIVWHRQLRAMTAPHGDEESLRVPSTKTPGKISSSFLQMNGSAKGSAGLQKDRIVS